METTIFYASNPSIQNGTMCVMLTILAPAFRHLEEDKTPSLQFGMLYRFQRKELRG